MRLTSRLLTLIVLIALLAFTNLFSVPGRADDDEFGGCTARCDTAYMRCWSACSDPNSSCANNCVTAQMACYGNCPGYIY